MKRAARIAVLLGLTFSAGLAPAHDDAYLDTQKAPNGGQLRMAGPYHFELVLAQDGGDLKTHPLVVHVTDHAGQKVPTAGATGTATLLVGKQKASAVLKPDGDNRLKGFARYAPAAGMKAVVSITLAGKPPEQARFTPAVPAMDPHAGHRH
ncbi:MAG: hypothetical protein EFKGCFLK_00778 [Rhodocyclaceae bacterium]|nr:hypothetical protein [Rhodocyclaceae bacterium]CAG0926488.1 hypothetical protein RHDC3_00053 [Rhodocyclaceae bacterium]